MGMADTVFVTELAGLALIFAGYRTITQAKGSAGRSAPVPHPREEATPPEQG
jgi:hypothetical protein